MTAPVELLNGSIVDNKFGRTSLIAKITSKLTHILSQAKRVSLRSRKAKAENGAKEKKPQSESMYPVEGGLPVLKRETDLAQNDRITEAETKTEAIQRSEKLQSHLACAASDSLHRLTLKMVSSQFLDKAVRLLDEAILHHQGDNIVGSRRSLTNLFRLLVMNEAQCFEFPSKYGLEVLHRGREAFFEKGVSCTIKHGTLLLDSSTSGAHFYSGLLNVMGAFALLISEFEIARRTFNRLIDLHHQSNTTSRSRDLAAAYNNKGCVHLIMGDLLDAHNAFETSLRSLGNSNGSSNGTKVFAVKSNISRLNLVFRRYHQALEQQEKLVESCKATEMKDISYPFEAVFTVMNNQAVLHTVLGNFNKAEQALWWLISYCKEMDREDSVYLVIFIRLHLSEVLLLHGKSKEANEVFSIEKLNSLDDIVDRFGNLYMNVRIEALEKLLELFIHRGKVKAALGLLQTTVKILKTVFGPDHFNIASLLYKQGTILSLTGEFSKATEKLKNSVEILRKIFGFKNSLLLKCYMSLGDVASRMNQEEESRLYFQRATENIEAIYHVSFVDELSVKYKEITQGFKTFQRQSALDDRIEGLVAEYGQGMAFLLNHKSNGQLRKCRADRKPVTVKKMDVQFSESMSIVSFKYSSDFMKTGQKLFRLGMIKEAAVFFQYAESHCGVHVIQGYPDLGVSRLHSIFLKEKFRCHGTLKHDHRFRNFLEDLRSVTEEVTGPQNIVKRIDGVETTMEFDFQRKLRPVLILLLLFSIELKMIETTFVAYDLYSKLFQSESSFPFLLLDGIQVFASKAVITCNGETAVQDILISSQIGPKESEAENTSTDTPLFNSLAYKESATENGFLVAGRTPFLLDIEDLNTVKEKISQAVQECFQMKCMETGAKGVATKVIVDLTSTAKCGLQDVFSMGSRIDLLPLCLSENPNNGVPHKETIFEIDTSMHQRITGVTFKDEQTSCFMFKKVALRLLQQRDARRISSIALPHHSLSLTVLHPGKARLNLSQIGKEIIQKIQFVTTRTKSTGVADSNGASQASVLDAISSTEIYQTIEKYKVPCQTRTLSEASSVQSVTLCETIDTSELEYRQEQTREKVLDCLRTVSQISQLLYSVESPLTDDDICLADPSQCHNSHGSLEDQEYLSKKHDISFVDLGYDDTRCLTASSQTREDQENTSLQHLTESSKRSENNEGLTLNAHDCTTVEVSTSNHEEESMLRADLCEMLVGKRLFEEDRQSRRSFMAELQESLKKKQLNSEKDDSIQSNRAEATNVSKLQSSQNGSSCGNLEVLHQNLEAQTPSGNPISRSVGNENSQRISSRDDKIAKEEDKLMKIHQLPQGPALYNVKDPNDLEMQPKCRLSKDVRGCLPKTTLEKEYCFTASNENDNSCLLERETYVTNVETARNDIHAGQQKAIRTNRETSPNQEVQGTIGVDQEGQRHTKPSGNKFKSRKQLPEEESERNEVEIRRNKGNTPEKQETPCSDFDDKATGKTFCPLAGDVLPDASMNKDTSGSQKNVVDLLKETDAVDRLNLKEENGMHSVKKREPTYPYGQIHSKSKATTSIRNESTTRYLCQGDNVVADSESHEDLNKNAVAVDGSVLVQNYHKDIHASVVIPNHEVQDVIGVEQRQTKPGVNKLEIREQHLVEDRERSGIEIMGNKSNTPEKRPDNDEMTSARIFKPLVEDVLLDGSMNKITSGSQKNMVDLLRETDAVDGSNLKVENGMHSVKKREPTYPYGQIHSKSRATISNHNESTTRSLCYQGGDVVADGESHEDLNKNAVVVDGSVLEMNCYRDIDAMVVMPNDEVQDAIAVDQRQTKPGVNKLEIREERLMEDKERSGVEIIANESNAPEKDGTSCPDYDETTAERTFEPLYEDVLPDGTKNKDTGTGQNNVVDLLRKTDAVDGPNLKEENETRSLKQSVGAVKLMDPHGQIQFKSEATFSNRHETTSGSMCHGGDVVADGGSREEPINNVDTEDGPALIQNLHKDFHADEKFRTSVKHESVTSGSENESHTDRHPLCESRYPLEPKSNFFQSYSGDGGARPKQRLTVNAKTPLPWPSIKNPMSANSDLDLPGLDPVFLARHVKESSPLLSFQNGGNYNHASSDCLWQEDYEQEYFSFNAQDQVFNSKDQKSHDKEEFIPRDKANRYDKVIPMNNALAPLAPPNGKEKESWHFPSESCKDTVLRSQCFAERKNESNPTSLPKSFEANREKLFSKCGSACAYNDMASMANDYSISVGNDECGQSLPMSENEHSWTENSFTANFRYLQKIMAKTIRLVALNATGARENDPTNQTVEKTGIQEETGDMGQAEAVVTQQIHETNTQGESTPSNETTVEAEQQPMAIPVQESPRPVCSHYQRRCLVRFPCCGKFFPCHRCHNESDCSEDQARAVNATHIRCTICYHEQEIDENGQRCGGCNAIMSEYFCPTCRHYTSVDKNPFHCEKCGICRIHRDRSFHCDVCNVCLDKRLEGKHKCRPDSGHDECCICLEDAFSGCQILPCSHKVHKDCAIAMIQNGVRTCPICRHPLFGQLQNSTQ